MQPEKIQSPCPDSYLTQQNRPTLCLCTGVGFGFVVALVSWSIGFAPSGHQLNDPIALGLAFSSLPRGTLYFDWTGLLKALGFSVGVGAASLFFLRVLGNIKNLEIIPEEAQRTATAALLTSVLPVLIKEVDAFQVLLLYGIATMFSVVLAGFTAKSLQRIF